MKPKTKRISLTLTEREYSELKRLSRKYRFSLSKVAREAIVLSIREVAK